MKARHLNNKTLKLKCKLQQKLLRRTKNLSKNQRPNKRTMTTKIKTMKEMVDFFVSKKKLKM